MADSDKNIIITPNRGATSQPQISFTGQGNDPITIRVLDGITGTGATAGGALSFEGSAGQLFSIVNRLGTGSIFSVNDISGIPSIDVDANGTIVFAGFTGNVGIGVTAPAQRLSVAGNISATGLVTGSGISTAGATFGGTVNMNANTVYQPTLRYYNEPYSQVGISGGGLTLDLSSAQVFGVTLNATVNSLSITNTPSTANRSIGFTIILTADGTARGVTWGSAVKWANNDPPALTTTNGKRDIFSFMSPDGGTNWFAFIAGLNF